MKLLFLVSSLDLTQPFSATPAWWQLMKGLYEIGVDVLAAPYQGAPVETLWWRAAENPAKFYGDAFKFARDMLRRVLPAPQTTPASADEDTAFDRLTRRAAQTLVAPRWEAHLDALLTREPDIDAVIVLTAPLNHLVGVARGLSAKHRKPFFYYDGDVPASLPSMRGFASGFRIYQGADLTEYAAFISNSLGGAQTLREMGANAVHTLYYGADPDVFAPVDVAQDIDVFFYGHGREYRSEWIDALLTVPSHQIKGAQFAARGKNLGDVGATRLLPYLSFSKLREYACRSKINLCITRAAHASVLSSSSSRPFELSALGCCIVGNPYSGVEAWFEPDKELLIVHSAEEAVERYRWLLAHDDERRAIGAAARVRLLAQHTFRHRARELVEIVRGYL